MATHSSNTHTTPRGIRNNNPGNIRALPHFRYIGQAAKDTDGFAIFHTPLAGISQLYYQLLIDYYEHGFHTVKDIIRSWAPDSENDTQKYVEFVEEQIATVKMDTPPSMLWFYVIGHAIILFENGGVPYSPFHMQKAFSEAAIRYLNDRKVNDHK